MKGKYWDWEVYWDVYLTKYIPHPDDSNSLTLMNIQFCTAVFHQGEKYSTFGAFGDREGSHCVHADCKQMISLEC